MIGTNNKTAGLLGKFKTIVYSPHTINTALYMAASLIPMMLYLAINPLLAQNLSPHDYAIIGYYKSFNLLFAPLIVFYMLHYYSKIYFEATDSKRIEIKATIFKSLIYFSFILSLISLVLLSFYCIYSGDSTNIPLYPYIAISLLSLPLTGIYQLRLLDYKMERKALRFLLLSVCNGLILFLCNLVFVVCLKYGALGGLLAPAITNVVFFCFICILYKNLFQYSFHWHEFKNIIKFCYPLTLAAMLGFFFNGFDRIALAKLGNNEELGIYVIGVQIGAYISVFQSSLASTFQPDLYKSLVERNFTKVLKLTTMLLLCTTIVVLIFVAMAPIIISILTADRYLDATPYARISSLSVIPAMLYYTVSQATIVLGKTRIILINKILSSIMSFLMFNIMIEHHHFTGAAWGLSLAFILCFIGNIFLLLITYRHKLLHLIKQ